MTEKLFIIRFIVKRYKGIINVAMVKKRFLHVFKQLRFTKTYKDVGKSRSQRRSHSYAVNLLVHNIVKTEFNRARGSLHQFNKNITREGRRCENTVVQSVCADFNSLCEGDISKKAGNVKRTKKICSFDVLTTFFVLLTFPAFLLMSPSQRLLKSAQTLCTTVFSHLLPSRVIFLLN